MTNLNDRSLWRFHKPDRSDYIPKLTKSEDNDKIDIGWAEGFMSGARPYRAEAWAQDGVTSVTFLFSTAGLETLSREQCCDLLEREGLIRFLQESRYVIHLPLRDASGRSIWAASVVIADEEREFAEDHIELHPYISSATPGASAFKAEELPKAGSSPNGVRPFMERGEILLTEEDYARHKMGPSVAFGTHPKAPTKSKPEPEPGAAPDRSSPEAG